MSDKNIIDQMTDAIDGEFDGLRAEILRLRAENEKLRAILFQFAAYDDDYENADSGQMIVITVPVGVIRAAAAALKETGDETP